MSVAAATIRAMTGDLERLPVPASPAGPAAGPAAMAGELLGRVRAELPAVGGLGEREQFLVSAWLTGLRSARTRRANAGDVVAWLGWLAERGTGALAAGRVHVDLWAATQLDAGAAESSVSARRSIHMHTILAIQPPCQPLFEVNRLKQSVRGPMAGRGCADAKREIFLVG
jgi:hypothetical protein